MSTNKLIWLLLGVAVVIFGVTCAPVDPSTSKESAAPDRVEKAPLETLPNAPTPLASGPRPRIEAAVRNVRQRDLLTTNAFWTIFHGILGLGPAMTLRNPETRERIHAIDYICNGGELRGLLFIPTKHGLDVQIGPLTVGQGHQDQFVAEMAQWGMPADQKFLVQGKEYTFMDFVRHAQMRARVTTNQELSWAILLLGQYLGTDISWTNGFGEKLHFEDLVRHELNASVEQAPCGGTHQLFGLSWVYHLHLQKGGLREGVWQGIADKTVQYRDLARKYQNSDGSFSTDFFRGPGDAADKQLRINTTGHTLEWLALALSDAELKEEWVQRAANALALMILDMQGSPIEGGSLYHAVHGLLLYYARVYDRDTLGPRELLIPLAPAGSVAKTSYWEREALKQAPEKNR
jgi:hypothetical protein